MPMESSLLKINRANSHIQELKGMVSTFLDSNPYRLFIKEDGMKNIIGFEITEALPPSVPLIIGDAIHNLRSSLDLLACSLVEKMGKSTNNVYFPFAKSQTELSAAIKNRNIYKSGKEVVQIIKDEIRPYKTGNYFLWALHKLDIVDKHKLIIPLIDIIEIKDVVAIDERNNRVHISSIKASGPNKTMNLVSMGRVVKFEHNPKATFGIFFQPGQLFEGEPVVPILNHLSKMVFGIVNRFEHFFTP
jgi:hypothetical protein